MSLSVEFFLKRTHAAFPERFTHPRALIHGVQGGFFLGKKLLDRVPPVYCNWKTAVAAVVTGLLCFSHGTATGTAQTVSPTQTVYAVCTASTAPSQFFYITNVFGVENSVGRKLRESWEQYIRAQYVNINPGSANCGAAESQEKAETGRQNALNSFNQIAQKLGTGHAPQLVQVQWQYQQTAAQAAPAMPATVAQTSASSPSSVGANPVQAVSNNTSAAGKNIAKSTQQSFDQSLQGMENSSTSTVTGAATTMTNSVNSSVQQGIGKLFHKPGTTPKNKAANQPEASATPSPTTGNLLVTPGAPSGPQPGNANMAVSTNTLAPAANGTPGPATRPGASAQTGPAMSIQDEGDGKHSLLIVAGKSDAQELTLQEGTKNIYLDETTGDKYVVMANGSIMRIPHKPAAGAK